MSLSEAASPFVMGEKVGGTSKKCCPRVEKQKRTK